MGRRPYSPPDGQCRCACTFASWCRGRAVLQLWASEPYLSYRDVSSLQLQSHESPRHHTQDVGAELWGYRVWCREVPHVSPGFCCDLFGCLRWTIHFMRSCQWRHAWAEDKDAGLSFSPDVCPGGFDLGAWCGMFAEVLPYRCRRKHRDAETREATGQTLPTTATKRNSGPFSLAPWHLDDHPTIRMCFTLQHFISPFKWDNCSRS